MVIIREIEFRGKVADEPDEWIYGWLVSKDRIYQEKETKNTKCCGVGIFNVKEETVGQYTGLKDKNGNKIYEGDIIEFSYDAFVGNFDTFIAKGKIVFMYGAFYIECFDNKGKTIYEIYLLYSINLDDIEKVGNIYDNPELLEGE